MKKILYILVFLFSLFMIDNEILAWSEYKIGREVEYNGIKFYVIKDSSSGEDSVTMLKKEPLTVDEVNLYGGVGTGANHVNMYVTDDSTASYYQTAKDQNGYGGIQYHSESNNYSTSYVKIVVDAWAEEKVQRGLVDVKLLTEDDLVNNLGYEEK